MDLTNADKTVLLDFARRRAFAAARQEDAPEPPRDRSVALQTGAGAFVTFRSKEGQLRGCIGALVAHAPLIETVGEMAEAASSRDPRFSPLTPEGAESAKIEISVLSAIEEITPANVVVGRHGLIVRQGNQSGLLLPQVATEHGWGREEFLSETCRKAGLDANAWREPSTLIYAFSAEVFGDE